MDRLTSNKSVSEMRMYELAHNSCYVKDGKARYRDYGNDFDARELAINLLNKFADIPNEFACDEDFDDFMADSLQCGMDEIQGLIAVFYRNLWAMADLRDRLKEYEDTGITPGQIREIDRLYAEKCKELAECRKTHLTGMKKLREYEALEEQGKLLKLPCAFGDTVYVIEVDEENFTHFHCPRKISEYKFNLQMLDLLGVFGKCIFLTREQAEAALEGSEDKNA